MTDEQYHDTDTPRIDLPSNLHEKVFDRLRTEEEAEERTEDLRKAYRPMQIAQHDARFIDEMTEADRQAALSPAEPSRLPPESLPEPAASEAYPNDENAPGVQPQTNHEMAREVFERSWFEQEATLEDLFPYRVMVAYRLVREMARVRGMVADEEMLADALAAHPGNPDPWTVPEPWVPPTNQRRLNSLPRAAVEVIEASERLPEEYHHRRVDPDRPGDEPEPKPGLGLLPPPVPGFFVDSYGRVGPEYTPGSDPALRLYVKLLDTLSRELYVDAGAPADRAMGRYGLKGLLDVETVRFAFPGRVQIVSYEMVLVQYTLDLLVKAGANYAKTRLKYDYGLQRHEVTSLIKLAKSFARQEMESDLEDDRAVMLMRFEDFVRRARESLDLRAEAAGLKNIAMILGLNRTEGNDAMSDFIDTVKKVTNERQQNSTPPSDQPRMIDQR